MGVDSPVKSVGEEFVDKLQCNNLIGPNHSSPLTALVSNPSGDLLNSGELEFLGFGDEDGHSWDGGPLAQWDPNEALVLVAEGCVTNDGIVEEDLEPLAWVSSFSKYVSFPIDSCESRCIVFFQKLEKAWEE